MTQVQAQPGRLRARAAAAAVRDQSGDEHRRRRLRLTASERPGARLGRTVTVPWQARRLGGTTMTGVQSLMTTQDRPAARLPPCPLAASVAALMMPTDGSPLSLPAGPTEIINGITSYN